MKNVMFSKEDCSYIKSFFDESLAIDGNTPKYFTYGETTVKITKKVSGLCCDIQNTSLANFILQRINYLNIKSINSDSVSIIKYSEGDYFGKHRDISRNGYGAVYKTLVIQLSDESEYTGGEFCIEEEPQSKQQGCCILFLSSKEHEVRKITSGVRYSLTIFLNYTDFINDKSII